MIKNIIFDFGGVVICLDQSQAIRRFEALGLEDAATRLDPYTQQGIFGELEEGKITADDFMTELGKLVGHPVSFEVCRHAWVGYCGEVPKRNLAALRELRRQGYRLILLSNTNPFMMDWAESDDFDGEGHGLAHYFDAMYKSYQVGVMKPDEQFFNHVLSSENINPSETLFVDDGKRNVMVASQLGINTFCPVNGADWTQEIYEYLT